MAVEKLAQDGENIRLLIAGHGSEDAQGSVRRTCAAIGNGSEYLGLVRRASDSVVPLLDALVLPSKAEGVPMAVLECLCAHVPIICTPVGGLGSLLTNGYDCTFVERNPASVAEAIKTMILDANLHRDMSFNARATYEQFGSVAQMVLGYSNVYEATRERWLHDHDSRSRKGLTCPCSLQ
jgi:glycosyltransferase involved in cell wall biosynthesis